MSPAAEPEPDPKADPISIAIEIEDQALAGRLRARLARVEGIRIVEAQEHAHVRLSSAGPPSASVPEPALTPREVEVLMLLAEGASNKTIARRLGISVHTAKFHVGQLLDKLDATGRTDAVAHAARLGVLHL